MKPPFDLEQVYNTTIGDAKIAILKTDVMINAETLYVMIIQQVDTANRETLYGNKRQMDKLMKTIGLGSKKCDKSVVISEMN